MRTMRLTDFPQGPALVEADEPQPRCGPGELLIRVRAAGVTPTELLWYPTLHTKTGDRRAGAVPGHEFSGVIEDVGADVGSREIGQEVFGMNDWFADGAMAEYCITQFPSVAPKPPRLTHVEAASVPIAALTAWQGLFDRAKVQAGERVLVHGGAGAVGVFAVQLARFRGAHVIATAAARNLEFVASLGAEEVIDYRSSPFEERVRELDVVFDTVGGETLERSWGILKPHGRLVTIAADGAKAADARVKDAFLLVAPDQKELSEIGDLLEAGRLRPVVDAVVSLSQASDAFTGRVARQGRGKLVVSVEA
jgi:NADPH:quinone reductase-like Zn-dependent oxidoreductase